MGEPLAMRDYDDFNDDDFPDDWDAIEGGLNCDTGEKEEGDELDPDELTEEQIAVIIAAQVAKTLEPKEYALKPTKKIIAVIDTETDPFAPGLIVKPFCLGVDTGDRYIDFWGDDCVKQFFDWLAVETATGYEYVFYAHNGGKFDFYFLLDYLDAGQSPLIMGGRLVKVYFQGQEFRDSFSIIPQALGAYKKDEIDYNEFTRDKREKNRKKILDYMRSDCRYTRELIIGFHKMFGDKLTIASASLPMLHSYHGFQRWNSLSQDERFRAFYYGGRNQCFETGLLKANWKVYDRNSMYPAVMRDEMHPISGAYELQRDIDENTDFACIDAINDNCLPTRKDDGGLDFTVKRGTFYATIHEIKAGLDTGTLTILRVRHAWAFKHKSNFAEFVNTFYQHRMDARANGDLVRDILYKFCLNSSYGKFALNPRKFKQWTFTVDEAPSPLVSPDNPDGWSLDSQSGTLFIWSRPAPRKNGFYNVATAASITGAARANLHRNLALATRPIYCDTDSIICTGFNGDLSESGLGGWKLEATGTLAAIGGKKLYTILDGETPIKSASKGVRLTPHDIISVCKGQTIRYENPVPNFKLDGSAEFVTRNIRMTG